MRGSSRSKVAIVGVGYSDVERHSRCSVGQLAVQACRKALDDAGLTAADVDGVANYPVPGGPYPPPVVDGVHIAGADYLSQALHLENLRWSLSLASGTVASAVVGAAHAVECGACNYALVWRAMHNPEGAFGRVTQPQVRGDAQFSAPWGFGHNVVRFAFPYSRYMARYGATRGHLATFLVRNRQNAAENPDGVFFRKPITREQYMGARMIAEPLSMLDCDMPVDGAGAVVITTADRAGDLRQKPAYILGGTSLGLATERAVGLTLEDLQTSASRLAAGVWSTTGMSASDITHAHLYDGFAYFPYLWLEAFGFYGEGEAYLALQDDTHSLSGKVPLNTSGGSMGMGRLHGTPQLIEAVLQIQRRAGSRQIANPAVGLVQIGGPVLHCGGLVLAESP